jgi:hypothetical protein
LLYEKGRVLHRRGLDQLEAEMMARQMREQAGRSRGRRNGRRRRGGSSGKFSLGQGW